LHRGSIKRFLKVEVGALVVDEPGTPEVDSPRSLVNLEVSMAHGFGEELPDIFKFIHWRIPDPGPPWLLELLDKDARVKLATNQLQLERDVLQARSAAIDRQLQILGGKRT
jgi:hypothetical protein